MEPAARNGRGGGLRPRCPWHSRLRASVRLVYPFGLALHAEVVHDEPVAVLCRIEKEAAAAALVDKAPEVSKRLLGTRTAERGEMLSESERDRIGTTTI